MRVWTLAAVLTAAVFLGACSRQDGADHNSPARTLGKAAYDLKRESSKFAKKAGQELKQAGQEAHQGWKEEKANPVFAVGGHGSK